MKLTNKQSQRENMSHFSSRMKRIIISKDLLQKSLPSSSGSSGDNTGESFFTTNLSPTDFTVHGSDG